MYTGLLDLLDLMITRVTDKPYVNRKQIDVAP